MPQSQKSMQSSRSAKSKKSNRSKASREYNTSQSLNPELEQSEISEADLDVLLNQHVKKAKKENKRLSNSIMKNSSRSPLKASKRPLTFKEQREQERIAETSNMGPGAHDGHLTAFGADNKSKIGMGSKYVTKIDSNPGAGHYDTDAAMKHVKPRTYEAKILGAEKKGPFIAPGLSVAPPDPGAYHKEEDFNRLTTNVSMGAKYEFKPDSNPGAGHYDIDSAMQHTQARGQSAMIRPPVSSYRRPVENNPGAGHYDGHLDKFGSKVTHKMDFGNKYVFKADKNPPPGAYEIDNANNQTQTKSRAAHIREETSPYRRPKDNDPGAGHYDGHLTAFGADIKTNIGMGSKYVFKADSNPPVGAYDLDASNKHTKSKSRAAHIKGETSPYRRPKENNPGAGHYDGHLTAFGADIKTNIGMGSKYVFKADKNPPVGAYEIDGGHMMTSTMKKSRSAHIRTEVHSFRRPKENNPGAGHYDGHLTAFGADVKTNIGMGSKYEFKPDKNPPVGAYDTESGLAMSTFKSKSAIIRPPTSPYRRPKENNPGPGHHDGHLTAFGADIKTNVGMGSKYEGREKPDSNPGIGYYNPDSGHAMSSMSKRSRSAHIRTEVHSFRRPQEQNPGAGHYDGHLDKFGSKVTHKMDFGNKYVFKADKNPAPGQYNIDSGHNMSKASAKSVIIREESSPYRRPKENTPGPGHHDGHLTAFGSDVKANIGMGSKYEFKPDSNPAVGSYDIQSGLNMSQKKTRSAHIKEETFSYRRPKESGPAPGAYDGHLDKFGSKVTHKMDFGNKYVFKPDRNPAPGQYNIDSGHNMSKASIKSVTIREETSPYRRPQENSPGPGAHDGHLTAFGADVKANIGMGSKYVFKPDSNPAVGSYDINSGLNMSQKKIRSAHISQDKHPQRRKAEESPDPGFYDRHLTNLGANITHKMDFGNKYVFKPDTNPAPGQYNIDSGHNMSKASSKSVIIREETSPYRRPQEKTPGPGEHDGHLTAFGADVTRNIGMGSKYEFKPDRNPAPGQYNIDSGNSYIKASSKSVIIREETSPYRRPKENSPGPGESGDGHLTVIGSGSNNITMGNKWVTKQNNNPAPGQYSPDHGQTKPSPKGGYIKPESGRIQRNVESGPAPGQYTSSNPYLQSAKIKPDVYVNSKYKDIIKEGPSATQYRPNDKVLSNRQRSPEVIIKESVMQMYDVDTPPYSPQKSTKPKGYKTPKSSRSSVSKASKSVSKTPKNQSSLKVQNALNMEKYLQTRNEIDNQYSEISATNLSQNKSQDRLLQQRGSENTGYDSNASPDQMDPNQTAFSNKLSNDNSFMNIQNETRYSNVNKTTFVERTSLTAEDQRDTSVLPQMEDQQRPPAFSIHEVQEQHEQDQQ